MDHKIIIYKNVFSRKESQEVDFQTFIGNTKEVLRLTEKENVFSQILDIKDKTDRNQFKRDNLPCGDLSQSGLLSIDIDGINGKDMKWKKETIIKKLLVLDTVFCLMDSVSGNLVVFFKYECSVKDFPYLYYKIYLELTLLCNTTIDFLPEIGRLRYLSNGKIHLYNKDAKSLFEVMDVPQLPYINTTVKVAGARKIVYGSN